MCILLCEPTDYSTKSALMGLNGVDYILIVLHASSKVI